MPVLRRAHEAEREGPVGRPEMALPVVRRQRHAFQRRGGQGARGLRRLAALARDAGRYAGARPNLQAEGRPLLADMADAGGGGRGLPRRLRRRHLDRARLRGAHSLQRRARAVVAPRARRDDRRVALAALAHRPARHGGHRRRQRLRLGGRGRMAEDEGPEMRVPRVLPGQEAYDVEAQAAGGRRALRAGQGVAACGDAPAGRLVGRALHAVVRVLVRLPRAEKPGRRPHGLHPPQAARGEVGARPARQCGGRCSRASTRRCAQRGRCPPPTTGSKGA